MRGEKLFSPPQVPDTSWGETDFAHALLFAHFPQNPVFICRMTRNKKSSRLFWMLATSKQPLDISLLTCMHGRDPCQENRKTKP